MTVRIYRSTDTSAPTLNGTAGALITLLDAVLVNGYGSQAAAGWTKAFTGTNKASYRNSASTGTGFYLYVDDAAPTTAKEARVTGFQTQSALGVGTGQFPTFGQLPFGTSPAGCVIWRKSTTADSTARAWVLLADQTVFYLFVDTQDFATSLVSPLGYMFGDFFSYKVSDGYRCMIIGRNIENPGNATAVLASEAFAALLGTFNGVNTSTFYEPIIGHYVAAEWTGIGTSVPVGVHIDHTLMGWPTGVSGVGSTGTTVFGSALFGNNTLNYAAMGYNPNGVGCLPYPHGPDQGLILSPVWVHHNGWKRGYLKGLWAPGHHQPLNHGDTYSGTGNLSGKSFLAQFLAIAGGQTNGSIFGPAQAQVHLETSDTWN